ncbi:acyl carrier protein [Streptomyces sp. S.PB5]|uniref:acyl carrier protein n=1 Tax=Streptomyces sp. S.PB5 TaxID=3020844 RepID=UPI0025AFA984|nr:acyl carrier protein [Streptomyces sp. S.PB5]MDN3027261.1 acyl carrier protein [Streptomyces sp. S.PB5]
MTSTPPIRDRAVRLAALVHTAWAEGLGHDEFRDDQNFLEVGGHSMCAARITQTLKSRLGVSLTVGEFLAHPTVTELSLFLADQVPAAHTATLGSGVLGSDVLDTRAGA